MSYYNANSSNLAPQMPNKMNFNYPNSNNLNSLNSAQNNMNPTNNLGNNMGNNFFFPQSQGNVYFLNTAQEINNIPIANNGVSVGLALSEGVLYLKAMQNGNIILNGYRLSALEQMNQNVETAQSTNENSVQPENTSNDNLLKEILDRLEALEGKKNKKGGTLEW